MLRQEDNVLNQLKLHSKILSQTKTNSSLVLSPLLSFYILHSLSMHMHGVTDFSSHLYDIVFCYPSLAFF
jgi:hypothetical protein